MSGSAAPRLRARLAALDSRCGDVESFSGAVCELIATAVSFDFGCLATTDPATNLITGVVKSAPDESGDEDFAHFEYAVDDVNQFSDIAQRPVPAGILSVDTAGVPEASARYREFLLPRYCFGDELRVAFRSRGRTWGVLGLYRDTGGAPFTQDDADTVARVSDIVARGIRRTLYLAAAARPSSPLGPAVIIVDSGNRLRHSTPAGEQLIDELGGMRRGSLPTCVLAAIAVARSTADLLSVCLRSRAGGWIVIQAAPLRRIDDAGAGGAGAGGAGAGGAGAGGAGADQTDVVVTFEPARPHEIAPIVLAAFGLTSREQDVAELVLRGTPTSGISGRLHLSPHTIQDHLKSVFAKAGVGSRRELIAKVFFDHHAPLLASPRNPDGSLAGTG